MRATSYVPDAKLDEAVLELGESIRRLREVMGDAAANELVADLYRAGDGFARRLILGAVGLPAILQAGLPVNPDWFHHDDEEAL